MQELLLAHTKDTERDTKQNVHAVHQEDVPYAEKSLLSVSTDAP